MEQRGNRRSGVNGPIHLSLEKEEEESRCSKDRVTLDLLLSFVVDMITVIKFFSPQRIESGTTQEVGTF